MKGCYLKLIQYLKLLHNKILSFLISRSLKPQFLLLPSQHLGSCLGGPMWARNLAGGDFVVMVAVGVVVVEVVVVELAMRGKK